MDIRESQPSAYRNTVAQALAEADIELAKANHDPDLLSEDIGVRVFAENHLARCISNAQAITSLAANIPERISDV